VKKKGEKKNIRDRAERIENERKEKEAKEKAEKERKERLNQMKTKILNLTALQASFPGTEADYNAIYREENTAVKEFLHKRRYSFEQSPAKKAKLTDLADEDEPLVDRAMEITTDLASSVANLNKNIDDPLQQAVTVTIPPTRKSAPAAIRRKISEDQDQDDLPPPTILQDPIADKPVKITRSRSETIIRTNIFRSPRASHKRLWTNKELEALIEGTNIHGVGHWAQILHNPTFKILKQSGRSSVDLKDKWRTYQKN